MNSKTCILPTLNKEHPYVPLHLSPDKSILYVIYVIVIDGKANFDELSSQNKQLKLEIILCALRILLISIALYVFFPNTF